MLTKFHELSCSLSDVFWHITFLYAKFKKTGDQIWIHKQYSTSSS